jgi:DNA-binding NtrC family response regulator
MSDGPLSPFSTESTTAESSHQYGILRASVTRMPRVLVGGDDPAMLCAVADVLVRSGCEVSRADSGADLVGQLACEGLFDLIVLNEHEAAVSKLIPSPPIAERPS